MNVLTIKSMYSLINLLKRLLYMDLHKKIRYLERISLNDSKNTKTSEKLWIYAIFRTKILVMDGCRKDG